jgi:hypothetical protein
MRDLMSLYESLLKKIKLLEESGIWREMTDRL